MKSYFIIFLISLFFVALIYRYRVQFEIKATEYVKDFVVIPILELGPFGSISITISPKFIKAQDFLVYGFHNTSSIYKPYRIYESFYAFLEKPGNAIFIFGFYSFFDSLFGPRGIIYNSPFLIFSIFGILNYKRKNKSLLLFFIFFIIFIFSYHSFGGTIPRYNRFLIVPSLLLSFFSFYYIQNEKRLWIKLIFTFLVVLSILNVTCLAIRADWIYEHEADLVSYDLCLWPYIPITKQENVVEYNLMSKAEQLKWVRSGEGNCRAQITDEGLMTDVCECKYNSWAERDIIFPGSLNLSVNACTHYAGGDGVKAKIYLDNEVIEEFFIPSNSCITKTIPINTTKTSHVIKLYSTINGTCDTEMVIWKSLVLK